MCVYVRMYMYTYVCACMYVYIYSYICACVCVYVCVCISVSVHACPRFPSGWESFSCDFLSEPDKYDFTLALLKCYSLCVRIWLYSGLVGTFLASTTMLVSVALVRIVTRGKVLFSIILELNKLESVQLKAAVWRKTE